MPQSILREGLKESGQKHIKGKSHFNAQYIFLFLTILSPIAIGRDVGEGMVAVGVGTARHFRQANVREDTYLSSHCLVFYVQGVTYTLNYAVPRNFLKFFYKSYT